MANKNNVSFTKLILFMVVLLIGIKVYPDGQLDTTFGSSGKVTNSSLAYANGVYIQSDGNLVSVAVPNVGYENSFVVTRNLTTGASDVTFGTAGDATIDLSSLNVTYVYPSGIAVQSDGKIVVVGTLSTGGADQMFVARLTSTGILDATFNAAGALPGVFIYPSFSADSVDFGIAVVVDVNGKIVSVGTTDSSMAVGRLNANGTLDTTLNGSGQLSFMLANTVSNVANAVALAADGESIIVAGAAIPTTGPAAEAQNFAYAALSPNGVIQNSAVTLFATLDSQLDDIVTECYSILIQPDGKIVLIGYADWDNGDNYFALARYFSTGGIDSSFVGTPYPIVNPNRNPGAFIAPVSSTGPGDGETSTALAGALQSDGKIIAAGYGPRISVSDFESRFMFARFDGANGTLDPSFQSGDAPPGFSFPALGTIGDECTSVALQGDGYFVGAGDVLVEFIPSDVYNWALARYVVADTPLQATTIVTPVDGAAFSAGPISFTGSAQNPSIVDFFLDGTQIQSDSTVTIGTGNSWSIPDVAIDPGVHTVQVVGRYRDDGHVNLAAQITFEICDVIAGNTGINDCVGGTVNGSLLSLVTGGTGPYTFSENGAPVGGLVTISSTGLYTFVATPGFTGVGSFSYAVVDPFGCTGVGTVDVTVASPIAGNTAALTCGASLSGNLNNLVIGGFGAKTFTGPLSLSCSGSTATISPSGLYTFVAPSGFTGPCNFVYQVTDSLGCIGTGTVTVVVNVSPHASNGTENTCQNTPVAGNLNAQMTGGTPPFTFAIVGTPVNGTVTLNATTGAYTFTPSTTFVGIGSFEFQGTDANGCVSNVATITVNIPCCPPTAAFPALIEQLYFNLPPVI